LTRLLATCIDAKGAIAVPECNRNIKALEDSEQKLYRQVIRKTAGYVLTHPRRGSEVNYCTSRAVAESHIDDPHEALLAKSVFCQRVDTATTEHAQDGVILHLVVILLTSRRLIEPLYHPVLRPIYQVSTLTYMV